MCSVQEHVEEFSLTAHGLCSAGENFSLQLQIVFLIYSFLAIALCGFVAAISNWLLGCRLNLEHVRAVKSLISLCSIIHTYTHERAHRHTHTQSCPRLRWSQTDSNGYVVSVTAVCCIENNKTGCDFIYIMVIVSALNDSSATQTKMWRWEGISLHLKCVNAFQNWLKLSLKQWDQSNVSFGKIKGKGE